MERAVLGTRNISKSVRAFQTPLWHTGMALDYGIGLVPRSSQIRVWLAHEGAAAVGLALRGWGAGLHREDGRIQASPTALESQPGLETVQPEGVWTCARPPGGQGCCGVSSAVHGIDNEMGYKWPPNWEEK